MPKVFYKSSREQNEKNKKSGGTNHRQQYISTYATLMYACVQRSQRGWLSERDKSNGALFLSEIHASHCDTPTDVSFVKNGRIKSDRLEFVLSCENPIDGNLETGNIGGGNFASFLRSALSRRGEKFLSSDPLDRAIRPVKFLITTEKELTRIKRTYVRLRDLHSRRFLLIQGSLVETQPYEVLSSITCEG